MLLPTGTRLGPYLIESSVGAGGMGEVYRALDTRLGRAVAIKILGAEASAPGFRERFEREARTISRLSHPNVCTLHDIGHEGSTPYLVMELLDGETLARRLARAAMPMAEVFSIGAQVAEGLAAAHALGIAHRDLKPGNVMLTPSGVKLLDFGLARQIELPGGTGSLATTLDASITTPGAIIGTLPYMAPEQVEGKPAGTPADIFALGCVLHEMAAGQRPFSGDTPMTLMSSILSSDPPSVGSLRPVPPQFDRIVRGCLAKDPARRWRSAADLAMQLRALADSDGAAAPVAERPRRRPWIWPVVAATALAVIAAGAFLRPPAPGIEGKPVRFSITPPPGQSLFQWVEGTTVAVAPDGSRIAFIAFDSTGVRRIWLRPLEDDVATVVPGTDGANSIMWSPDGQALAFFTQRTLKRTRLDGSVPVTICDVNMIGVAGSWGRRDDIVFAGVQGGAVYRVPASGGTPEAILQAEGSGVGTRWRWPSFLPDGASFLCLMTRQEGTDSIVVVEPGGGRHPIIAAESRAEFAEPGHLLYVRDGTLMAHRFDWRARRMQGSPVAVAQRISYFLSNGAATFHTSKDGTLAYAHPFGSSRLAWIDRNGREVGTLGERRNYLHVSISPDGSRLLASIGAEGTGTYDVWSIDLARGDATRVTGGRDTEAYGTWMPDQRGIIYTANRGRVPWLHRHDLTTGESVLLRSEGFAIPGSVTPDGRTLLFQERDEEGWDIWTVSLGDSARVAPYQNLDADEGSPRISTDGKYVAFTSNETGSSELYLSPYPGPGERMRLSTGGANSPVWNPSHGEILYLSPRGVVSLPVATAPRLVIGSPRVIAAPAPGERWGTFDVAPDGSRLLVIAADRRPPSHIEVLVHWPEIVAR